MFTQIKTIILTLFVVATVGVALQSTVVLRANSVARATNAPVSTTDSVDVPIHSATEAVLSDVPNQQQSSTRPASEGSRKNGATHVVTTVNPTAKSTPPNKVTPSTVTSLSTVATHNTKSNCWIVISGSIYDVTSFLTNHPGGVSAITPYCGKDATSAFQTHGRSGGSNHSSYAYSLLPTYFVGTLAASQLPTTTYAVSVSSGHGTVTSSPSGISCGATCSASFTSGTTVSLSATAASGYTFSGWSGACSGSSTCVFSITNNVAVTANYTASAPPPASGTTYTTSQVAPHNAQGDCWLIISNKVYNVTSWISSHPGGANAIISRCGTDATAVFTTNVAGGHAHSAYANSLLPSYYVGDLTVATPPPAGSTTYTVSISKSGTGSGTVSGGAISCGSTCSATIAAASTVILTATPATNSAFSGWGGACSGTGTCTFTAQANTSVTASFTSNGAAATSYTATQVATHSVRADCWIIISNKVYDVTQWINSHPGGVNAIVSRCGTDSTTAFTTSGGGGHRHSASATAMLASYYVGDLSGTTGGGSGGTSFTLSVTKSGTGSGTISGGGISCGSTCSASINSGTVVALSASASSGSTFAGWGGACSGTGSCSVTMSAAQSVSAQFTSMGAGGGTTGTPATYTINVNSAGNYDTTSITLQAGDSITFVYTAPRSGEVKTQFSPSGISSVTLDSERTSRTRTFPNAGTWTFSAADHNGNQGIVIVQ